MARIELAFPLPPDECTARLAAGTNRTRALFFEDEPKAVYGRVEAGLVNVRRRAPRSQLQMCLSGAFEARGPGTVFRGRIGWDVSSWCALVVFVMNALVWAFLLTVNANSTSSGIGPWLLLALPLVTVVGAFSLWRDWRRARGEGAFLVEFLRRTLGGTADENAPASSEVRARAGFGGHL
ncbi:unnamed protein product [Gemmata massiliana]|uniref:Uncharacterized protein n=1 Tax=Gemmata massiliana TaxID=1210884 RepID=A0A6P2CZT4_9BACT|nr:hypothetical protein [Gemmata massiliana]VTR93314.1 unnamed protein product [Gemmata massiliana]